MRHIAHGRHLRGGLVDLREGGRAFRRGIRGLPLRPLLRLHLFDLGVHLRQHLREQGDQPRVELLPDPVLQHLDRCFPRQRPPVRPVGGEGVERIDEADDPSADRDRLAPQAIGIPQPVPALVVRPHDVDHRERERDRGEDLRPDGHVRLDAPELFRGQLARLAQNVVGDAQLADVVHQRPGRHRFQLRAAHPRRLRQRGGVVADAVDVRAGDAVLRVDRGGQRGNDRLVELVQLLDMRHVLLQVVGVEVETLHIEPVGGVDQVEGREKDQRHPAVTLLVHRIDAHGRGSGSEIAGGGPEEVFPPHGEPGQLLLKGDRQRHPQRVDRKIDGRKGDQARHRRPRGRRRPAVDPRISEGGQQAGEQAVAEVEAEPIQWGTQDLQLPPPGPRTQEGARRRARRRAEEGRRQPLQELRQADDGKRQGHAPLENSQLDLPGAKDQGEQQQQTQFVEVSGPHRLPQQRGRRKNQHMRQDVSPQPDRKLRESHIPYCGRCRTRDEGRG